MYFRLGQNTKIQTSQNSGNLSIKEITSTRNHETADIPLIFLTYWIERLFVAPAVYLFHPSYGDPCLGDPAIFGDPFGGGTFGDPHVDPFVDPTGRPTLETTPSVTPISGTPFRGHTFGDLPL